MNWQDLIKGTLKEWAGRTNWQDLASETLKKWLRMDSFMRRQMNPQRETDWQDNHNPNQSRSRPILTLPIIQLICTLLAIVLTLALFWVNFIAIKMYGGFIWLYLILSVLSVLALVFCIRQKNLVETIFAYVVFACLGLFWIFFANETLAYSEDILFFIKGEYGVDKSMAIWVALLSAVLALFSLIGFVLTLIEKFPKLLWLLLLIPLAYGIYIAFENL